MKDVRLIVRESFVIGRGKRLKAEAYLTDFGWFVRMNGHWCASERFETKQEVLDWARNERKEEFRRAFLIRLLVEISDGTFQYEESKRLHSRVMRFSPDTFRNFADFDEMVSDTKKLL